MGLIGTVRERMGARRALEIDNARLRADSAMVRANGGVLVEHLADVEAQLAEDEAGWRRVDNDQGEWSHDRRRRAVVLARLFALKNPLVRRQVRTQVAYVFGQGVEIAARTDEVNEVIQRFLDDHRNRDVFTSALGLADREMDLQTDGEVFLGLWTGRDDFGVTVRPLPPLEVEHILANPEDRYEPWFYLRSFRLRTDAGLEERRLAYIDHRYARTLASDTGAATDPPAQVEYAGHTWEVARDVDGQAVPVIHVAVGKVGEMRRGLPEVLAMLDWARAYKEWLEDWAAISKSLARFAWRMSVNRNAGAAAERLGSKLSTDTADTNPAPIPGSVFLGTPGNTMEPIRTAGAQASAEDGLQIRKMASAGSSFPDTIIGADPDMGNLATARTLDRPTELTIRMRQELWRTVIRDVALFVVAAAIDADELEGRVENDRGNLVIDLGVDKQGDPVPATVDVEFPPVLEPDTATDVDAAMAAQAVLPPRVLLSYLLTSLGIDDQDEILAAVFADDQDPYGLASRAQTPEPPEPGAEDEEAAESLSVAVAGLREAVTKLAAEVTVKP